MGLSSVSDKLAVALRVDLNFNEIECPIAGVVVDKTRATPWFFRSLSFAMRMSISMRIVP